MFVGMSKSNYKKNQISFSIIWMQDVFIEITKSYKHIFNRFKALLSVVGLMLSFEGFENLWSEKSNPITFFEKNDQNLRKANTFFSIKSQFFNMWAKLIDFWIF